MRYEEQLRLPTIGGSSGLLAQNEVFQGVQELCRVNVAAEDAQPWSVCLLPPPRYSTAEESEDIRRTAVRVSFGNGGIQAEVDVDWRQGWVHQFFGSFLKVDLLLNTVPQPAVAAYDLSELAAFISPGGHAPTLPLTRTVNYNLIAAAGNQTLPVPRFARRAMLTWITTSTAPTMDLEYQRAGGAGLASTILAISSGNRNRPDLFLRHDVPFNATLLDITNTLGALAITPSVVYELAI
jgi:hypothetical protein